MKKYFKYLRRVKGFVEKDKKQIATTIVLNFTVVLLDLLLPIMNKTLIDEIIIQSKWTMLPNFIIVMVIIYFASIIINLISNRIYASFSERIWAHSRGDLLEKVLFQSFTFRNNYEIGDIIQRINTDSASLHIPHSYFLDTFLINAVKILGTIIIIFYLNPFLAIITCISIPAFLLLSKFFSNKFEAEVKNIKSCNASLQTNLLNTLSFFNTIKANALEKIFKNRFETINDKALEAQVKTEYTGYLLRSIVSLITTLNQLIVIIVGAVLIMHGKMTAGILVAFLAYSTNLYVPFVAISNILKELNSTYVSIDRYLEIYDAATSGAENYLSNSELMEIKEINADNISFGYTDKDIFKYLSFNAKQSDIIQIVGRSGIGKSTIARIFTRLLELQSGNIYINKKDYTIYNLKSLRNEICWITQEQELLDGTIRNYLTAFGDFTDSEMLSAIKKANLLELSADTKNNGNILDIIIDKSGSTLSGGQRQRLILARLFLSKGSLLFLDEPFNGIDAKSKDIIWENIIQMYTDKIIFVVDHSDYFAKIKTGEIILGGI